MTVEFPDVMLDVRYWLRNHGDLQPLHNSRVFFRMPDALNSFPSMRIYDAGTAPQATGGDLPCQDALVGIECWHNKPSGYQAVRQLAIATQSALFTLPATTLINPSGNTIVLDATVQSSLDSEDPELGWPRYVITAHLIVVASFSIPE